jgi:CIC family chloride channel protein
LLVVAKLLVTCLTLGSGASGGVFSPSMFLGAALGGCFGSALLHVLPDLPMTPAHFAYAGMAGMVGGTTGAVLTGTIMIFEMTRDYTVILPVILTVVLACAVRNWLSPSTIYTLKLLRRGEIVPQGLQARLGEVKSRHLMTGDFLLLPQGQASNPDIVREALLREHVVVVTGLDDRILGVFDERSRLDYPCGQFPPPGCCHVVVDPEAPLNAVLRAIDQAGARVALVTRISPAEIPKVLGVITERDIARLAYATARLTD